MGPDTVNVQFQQLDKWMRTLEDEKKRQKEMEAPPDASLTRAIELINNALNGGGIKTDQKLLSARFGPNDQYSLEDYMKSLTVLNPIRDTPRRPQPPSQKLPSPIRTKFTQPPMQSRAQSAPPPERIKEEDNRSLKKEVANLKKNLRQIKLKAKKDDMPNEKTGDRQNLRL